MSARVDNNISRVYVPTPRITDKNMLADKPVPGGAANTAGTIAPAVANMIEIEDRVPEMEVGVSWLTVTFVALCVVLLVLLIWMVVKYNQANSKLAEYTQREMVRETPPEFERVAQYAQMQVPQPAPQPVQAQPVQYAPAPLQTPAQPAVQPAEAPTESRLHTIVEEPDDSLNASSREALESVLSRVRVDAHVPEDDAEEVAKRPATRRSRKQ